MHIDPDRPLLEFNNLWVHGRPVVDSNNPKHSSGEQTKTFAPHKLYQRWSNKRQKNALSDGLSPHSRILVNDASGKLLSGQVTVLTGASGSGKSVLLRVLAGLLPMTTGDIHLRSDATPNQNHKSIHTASPTDWRKHVALLAQHPQLLEGSVLENLKMPYDLHAHRTQSFDRAWHISQLETLNRHSDFLQQEAHHLSGGERQLVNTLRLLQLNPQVLLLDEPTAALDIDTSAQLVHLLMRWLQADTQRTLLWVTHDTKDIMPLAHRHWRMQAGVLTEVL
ncbi:ATP-binding cassette domain-containing protein [Psychrobacter sp. Ps6]|uniref:ABC transporter ATP-binding protein n=1 Tax=Psychrobacter sp. Ps6 TaxID=2790960 RepID=UPI001EDCAAD6|nr:ATP-binding cassette domain-containing protein [Psychrobacter sp. Ps6]MCG3880313.1 ATP-binding cassette domain-containing protein [Psychrobacter sp. Ps6]